MARPIKSIKRQIKLTVYYTRSEYKMIVKKAKQCGLPNAVFVRHKSLNNRVKPRLTPEEVDFYRQLAGMANNLNQLAHSANSGRFFSAHILKAIEEINFAVSKLK